MTTLYFEAPDGDGLRKTGFSKDGNPHCPQIMTGLLAGPVGYLSGYDIYEGIRDNRLPTGSLPFEFYVFIKFYPRKVTLFFIFLSKCKSKVTGLLPAGYL
jgi:hypothetical protein